MLDTLKAEDRKSGVEIVDERRADGPALQIALLTPYSGGNFGDAAIQDAMIANLRTRLPKAQFSGITLNSENFLERHGSRAFPLCSWRRYLYGMARGTAKLSGDALKRPQGKKIKAVLRYIPGVKQTANAWRELRHWMRGYSFIKGHDVLIISGGGQLDEEWGGAWGHPYALFKWTTLAGLTGVPVAFTSVGACKAKSATARFFLSRALRKAGYRSYRDSNSRAIAATLFSPALNDAVVPDVAMSMPASELPCDARVRALAGGRKIIAISPISYGKPQNWPREDRTVYERYLEQMARAVSEFLARGYFLLMVWSSRADRETVAEILSRLPDEIRKKYAQQIHVPEIDSWRELVALLSAADYLIASRLHSVILGFVTHKPVIAISFDPKVDWVMQDLEMSVYRLQIHNFSATDVMDTFSKIAGSSNEITAQIGAYLHQIDPLSARQYDALVETILVNVKQQAGKKN